MKLPSWWAVAGLAYPAWRLLQEAGFESFMVQDHWVVQAITRYLYEVGTPVMFGSKAYGGRLLGQSQDSVAEAWEGLGPYERCFILPSGVPVWAVRESKTESHGAIGVATVVKYLRFTLDPDALITSALLHYEDKQREESVTAYEYCTVSGTGHTQHQVSEGVVVSAHDITDGRKVLWQPDRRKPPVRLELEDLPMTVAQENVVSEVQRWHGAREWYQARKIPWRRGYMLYGSPGTGKTTFVQAIARHLGVRMVSFDLATFGNVQFPKVWRTWTQGGQPQVVLLEDLDAVFNGRENITGGTAFEQEEGSGSHWSSGLSWDCLLSVLDGVEVSEGVLLFVTTNRPERLDGSLATVKEGKAEVRPGRIDKAVCFAALDDKGIFQVAERLLQDRDKAERVTRRIKMEATVADVQEACVHEALTEFWTTKKGTG